MGMKFLNKKGWHTGSLRNIENVWKAEQKHEQEQKKLEELRKQIVEERERAEFRQLQEQAGLVPRQERLDFLYDSGLSVGKSSEGFKSLEAYPKSEESTVGASTSAAPQSATPGALFEVKPQSANDSWRKLHSDPLLMIRQREQEALARIKNNPVKMAMIRRSVEESKKKDNSSDKKKKKKHGEKKSSHKKHSSRTRRSYDEDDDNEDRRRRANSGSESPKNDKQYATEKLGSDSEEDVKENGNRRMNDREGRGKDNYDKGSRHHRDVSRGSDSDDEARGRGIHRKNVRESRGKETRDKGLRHYRDVRHGSNSDEEFTVRAGGRKDDGSHPRDGKQYKDGRHGSDDYRERDRLKDSKNKHEGSNTRESRDSDDYSRSDRKYKKSIKDDDSGHRGSIHNSQKKEAISAAAPSMTDASVRAPDHAPQNRRKKAPKLSDEERAARLREMQLDAELHEEQRWKRLKKADEDDAREAALATVAKGKNFLEVAKKNVYGAEQGGSATIEESVRRRSHYLQGRSATDAGNAFRR